MVRFIKILFVGVFVGLISGCSILEKLISPKKSQKAAPINRIDNTQNQYYTVQMGETLYEVGRKLNVTERALILWNNIPSPYILKSGQVLKVFPSSIIMNGMLVNAPESGENNFNNAQELDDESLNDYSLRDQQMQEYFAPTEEKINTNLQLRNAENNNLERQNNHGKYIIQSGDTLLSIAHSFDLSLSQISNLNNIYPPYQVNVGQILIIETSQTENNPQIYSKASKSGSSSKLMTDSQTKVVINEEIISMKKNTVKDMTNEHGGVKWLWPIKSDTVIDSNTNIALLSGSNGQDILAACRGEVIYAGVGVQGYGKMIIIQCRSNYISAYSNLKNITTNEGDKVLLGQVIGHLGKFKGQSELGFEIRHLGDPVKLNSIMQK